MRKSSYISLFNGISAGRLALDSIGKKFDYYYISEIDKYANQVSEYHYPDNIQLGDVTQWETWALDWSTVDLITAGFPCQSWSVAGHQLGDKDERGKLFWVMLDIMKHANSFNPEVKFLIENVKMKREFEEYITHHTTSSLGEINKILINSSSLSAQNRNRYYWTNFKVEQPPELGIMLNDVIDGDFSSDRDKSYCIDANYHKGGNPDQYFNKSRRQLLFSSGDIISLASRGRYNEDGSTSQKIEIRSKEKENTVTTVTKDSLIGMVFDGSVVYRKLSVKECARLQTFPDDWCNMVSNTQAYKCLGNAWTVDVISHILGNIKNDG